MGGLAAYTLQSSDYEVLLSVRHWYPTMTSTQHNETVKVLDKAIGRCARAGQTENWFSTLSCNCPSVTLQYSQFMQNSAVMAMFPNMAADFITRVSFATYSCVELLDFLCSPRTLVRSRNLEYGRGDTLSWPRDLYPEKFGTNFAGKWRSPGRYSSLAD
jgi:hypothetical protein